MLSPHGSGGADPSPREACDLGLDNRSITGSCSILVLGSDLSPSYSVHALGPCEGPENCLLTTASGGSKRSRASAGDMGLTTSFLSVLAI